MPNPLLTPTQLLQAQRILADVRHRLSEASAGDAELLFALRRKVQKELIYDERNKPAHRNRIKRLKRIEQDGRCPVCGDSLPEKYAVLDRFEAVKGYTIQNTRLIHQKCDTRLQAEKGYA
jgi:DNA repair exonuclease SbcCD ATPase subunit